MINRKGAVPVLLVLLGILVFHLAVGWQDLATLSRNGYLYDDSFYAFNIARNIASGEGMTFDGEHPTTGFQPLYVFILVPIYYLWGSDPVLPIHIALSISALLTALTAFLVYRIASRYTGRAAAALAALLWSLSPIVTRQTANGLETAMASFFIALCILYYLEKVRSDVRVSASRSLVLGLLLGVCILSRIDGVFLALAISLDRLLVMRRDRVGPRALLRLSAMPAGALALFGPWLAFNMITSGSPLQDSGTATRFLSLAYASYFNYGGPGLISNGPDAHFISEHVIHSLSTLKVIPLVHVVFRAIDRVGGLFGMKEGFHSAGNILGILLLAGFPVILRGWGKNRDKAARRELDFVLLFVLLLLLSYSLYIFGAFFFLRYFYPVFLAAGIFSAFIFQDLFDWYRARSRSFKLATAAAGAAYAVLFGYFSYSQAFRSIPIYPFYDISQWIQKNTGPHDKIGVFQCGTIGYLSGREIINLDGKVNRDALKALQSGSLPDYLSQEGIDLVIDDLKILSIFIDLPPDRVRKRCTPIQGGDMRFRCGWVAFRPETEHETSSAAAGHLSAQRRSGDV